MSITSSIFPALSCTSFKVSGLILRSLIHFELVLVWHDKHGPSFNFLQADIQFAQQHLLKRLSASLYSDNLIGIFKYSTEFVLISPNRCLIFKSSSYSLIVPFYYIHLWLSWCHLLETALMFSFIISSIPWFLFVSSQDPTSVYFVLTPSWYHLSPLIFLVHISELWSGQLFPLRLLWISSAFGYMAMIFRRQQAASPVCGDAGPIRRQASL
jgi:hypothetical protein